MKVGSIQPKQQKLPKQDGQTENYFKASLRIKNHLHTTYNRIRTELIQVTRRQLNQTSDAEVINSSAQQIIDQLMLRITEEKGSLTKAYQEASYYQLLDSVADSILDDLKRFSSMERCRIPAELQRPVSSSDLHDEQWRWQCTVL